MLPLLWSTIYLSLSSSLSRGSWRQTGCLQECHAQADGSTVWLQNCHPKEDHGGWRLDPELHVETKFIGGEKPGALEEEALCERQEPPPAVQQRNNQAGPHGRLPWCPAEPCVWGVQLPCPGRLLQEQTAPPCNSQKHFLSEHCKDN